METSKNNKLTRSPRRTGKQRPVRVPSRDASMGEHLAVERERSIHRKNSRAATRSSSRLQYSRHDSSAGGEALTSMTTSKSYSSSDDEDKLKPISKTGSSFGVNVGYDTNFRSHELADFQASFSPPLAYSDADQPSAIRNNDAMTITSITAHGISSAPNVEYGQITGYQDTLAVAFAVDYCDEEEEEDEKVFMPAALEYEPDSKPPIYKNRRFRFYLICATILLTAIGAGAAKIVSETQSRAAYAPSASPTTTRDELGIVDQLMTVVGEKTVMYGENEDVTSPQARAVQWIINEDPLQLEPDDGHLVQRFLLVLFYMSTTQHQPWRSCNPVHPESSGEHPYLCNYTKLTEILPEVAYENVTLGRWLSSAHECSWAGVFCDEFNQTRALELPGQEIRGTFPTEIALMPYLQSLAMTWNEFYGTMPSELANMKHLLNIEFHNNFFTGHIPKEWYNAQALQRVNIAENFMSGTISSEIGQMSTLKGFFSFENGISGTIPTEIGDMKFLAFTRVSRNFLSGNIPSEIGNLVRLQEAWLHVNGFTGTLPSEMGNMKGLGDLRVYMNAFSGTVPEEHYSMSQLRRWDLHDCKLTSTISTSIGLMTNLQTYRIQNNDFYGTIPTELGLLTRLNALWLYQNDFTGSVPMQVCVNRGQNGITVLDADCLTSNNGLIEPPVSCLSQCCTGCCDTTSGFCVRESMSESR